MNNYLHRCLIVPDSFAPAVRALCAGMAPGAGDNMFLRELSPSGNAPATHWISAGMQGDDFCDLLPLTSVTTDRQGIVTTATRPGKPADIVLRAGKAGATVTRPQIDAILAACDISEQNGHVAMARLGLQMVRKVLP